MIQKAEDLSHAKEQLEQILLSAINSGHPIDVTSGMVEDVRQKLRARTTQRKAAEQ
jgi:hypothetical protein